MSRRDKDRASVYIARIRNHRWIAMLVAGGVVLGGVAGFTTTIGTAMSTVRGWLYPYDPPRLLQFTVDLSKSSFYERTEPKFGAGPPIRTFLMDPSFFGVVKTGRAIFQVSMENPNDQDLVVTGIAYHVHELGEVLGGVPGPLESKYTYFHELKYATGTQRYDLVPPFFIPARSAGSFSVELYTKDTRPGLAWVMDVEFQTSAGSVQTNTFQLILSGKGGE